MWKVIVLDDHPIIIDGLISRLARTDTMRIVGYANYGENLRPLLNLHNPNVVILDINVAVSHTNPNPYAVFAELDYIQQYYPQTMSLMFTMHSGRIMIYNCFEHGATGYLLKDDIDGWNRLDKIIEGLFVEQLYISPACRDELRKAKTANLNILNNTQTSILSLIDAYPSITTLQIAKWMGKAHSTIRNQLSLTYAKLGVSNRHEAILKAWQLGILLNPADNPLEQVAYLRTLPDQILFEHHQIGSKNATQVLRERGLL